MATEQDIARLSAGIKAAAARGDMDTARTIGVRLRELQSAQAAPAESAPVQQRNPTDEMGGFDRFRAGVGAGMEEGALALRNTFNDASQWAVENVPGLRQADELGAGAGLPTTGQVVARDRAEQLQVRERNAPLRETTAGGIGNMIGTAAVVAPTALIPGAGTYTGAALIGAGTGAALSDEGDRASGAGVGVVGGVLGKYLGDRAGAFLRTTSGRVRQAIGEGRNADDAARAALVEALRTNNVDIGQIPERARAELLAEVKRALATGGAIDSAALGRKADFTTIGATPTLGQITRDPQQFAFEQTLQGVQGAGRPLAEVAQNNNKALIDALNSAGANRSGVDLAVSIDTGKKAIRAANQYAGTRKAEIDALYQRARDLNGGDIPLDGVDFVQRARGALTSPSENKQFFLPPEIDSILKAVEKGDINLTVGTAESLKTIMATASRSGAADGNTKRAISLVRDALENTNPRNYGSGLGEETVSAFNAARAANRKYMGQVEKNPFLKAVIDGESPDDAFRNHFATADVGDVRRAMATIRGDDGAISAVKAEAMNFLKRGAIGDSADEVANFSQAGFSRALARIGTPRLRAMGFTEQEIGTLRTIGRVSTYMQKPPAGAKVNNSNTAAQGYNLLMGLLDKFRKVPLGGPAVADPGADIIGGVAARSATRAAVPVAPTPSVFDLVGRGGSSAGAVTLLDLLQ